MKQFIAAVAAFLFAPVALAWNGPAYELTDNQIFQDTNWEYVITDPYAGHGMQTGKGHMVMGVQGNSGSGYGLLLAYMYFDHLLDDPNQQNDQPLFIVDMTNARWSAQGEGLAASCKVTGGYNIPHDYNFSDFTYCEVAYLPATKRTTISIATARGRGISVALEMDVAFPVAD